MDQNGSMLSFIIVAFSFALIILFKKNDIPPRLRRGLAIVAIVLVSFSFFLIVYSFFSAYVMIGWSY